VKEVLERFDNLTPVKVCESILSILEEKKLSPIQAVLYFCEENSIQERDIAPLLSPTIKEMIRIEAEELHFLKKTSRLPM
jgi:hypothetical protein